MCNQKSINFFKELAETTDNPKSVKIRSFNDYTDYDANFILRYVDNDTNLLDLASGTGLVINKIADRVKNITAVELFEQFSKYIEIRDNIKVVNIDIQNFRSDEKYNLITMFGIMHYFNKNEATELYKKYYDYLLPKGKLIVKNQFALDDDVVVDGYSEELNKKYYSEYRNLDKEIDVLKLIGFKNIEKYDIYPPEANRWDNTHFYAIVAER